LPNYSKEDSWESWHPEPIGTGLCLRADSRLLCWINALPLIKVLSSYNKISLLKKKKKHITETTVFGIGQLFILHVMLLRYSLS